MLVQCDFMIVLEKKYHLMTSIKKFNIPHKKPLITITTQLLNINTTKFQIEREPVYLLGAFMLLFFHVGVLMGGLLGLPPPLRKFLWVPMICELLEPRVKYGRTKMLIDL